MSTTFMPTIHVDVLIPVHNASATIQETVDSAMKQRIPLHLQDFFTARPLDVAVCCYNDGSIDDSWKKLQSLKEQYDGKVEPHSDEQASEDSIIRSTLLIRSGSESRGAPYARNQAAVMRSKQSDDHVLVWLDSDDTMHPHRIPEQVHALFHSDDRDWLLLGSQFDRDPPDSTWHYAQWANNLTDERLMLERYREVTILQPTWCMMRSRFEQLGGYITTCLNEEKGATDDSSILRLVHANDTTETIRLAEDIRFLHAHLHADNGLLRLVRKQLVTYRHRAGQSQSSQTPRRLLLQLRTMAFERTVLTTKWDKFVVWGAGRDGKEFVKALSVEARTRVVCMVDVDHKKITTGHYMYKEMSIHIPIVHFSLLVKDLKAREALQEAYFSQVDNEPGRITKERPSIKDVTTTKVTSTKPPPRKKFKVCTISDLDTEVLPSLPVVVCVAMYRTNGVLEKNVASIDRTEGQDLWHFS
jgi:glycosyltransferase involved in cell wall biosynthesis